MILISLGACVLSTVSNARVRSEEPEVFAKCWDAGVSPNLGIAPATDASAAYFVDDENKLRSIDLVAGRNIWSSEVGGEVVSNLIVLDDSIFLATRSQSDIGHPPAKTIVRAISRETGITLWQVEATSSPATWLGAASGNVIAVGSDGAVAAFSRGEGKLIWKADLKSGITSEPNFHDSSIELGTLNREVIRISTATGASQIAWRSRYLPTAVFTEEAGRLIVGDERGNLTVVSSAGSKEWRFRNAAQISSALLHDSEYLAASYDNFVYKLSHGGNVKWKRRLPGRVVDKPLVLGDGAVVSIVGTGSVYGLDLRNGKILNRIETGEDVSLRIAATGDGRGFIVAGPQQLSYFSSKCPPK